MILEFKEIVKSYNLACWYKDMDNLDQCIVQLKKWVDMLSAINLKIDHKFNKHLFTTTKVQLSMKNSLIS